MRTLLALAALLAAALPAPAAAADPHLDPSARLHADVPATAEAAAVEYAVPFRLDAAGEAYLKVSPAPGNPAFANGTAGGDGWWTGVRLDGPDGILLEAQTAGDPPVRFGALQAGVPYTLRLTVHAPAGALREPGDLRLEYVLAQRAPSGAGSGGTLDPSLGLHLVLRTVGDPVPAAPPAPQAEPGPAPQEGLPSWLPRAGGAAAGLLAATLALLAARRRLRRRPQP